MAMEALSNNKISEYQLVTSQTINEVMLNENSGDSLSGNLAYDGIRN